MNQLTFLVFSTLCFVICFCTEKKATQSPWEHNNQELAQEVKLPVKYPETFTRERELFAYNPRFVATKVSFMPDNTPVMRFGVLGQTGSHRMPYKGRIAKPGNYIQYLQKDEKWCASNSHVQAIKNYLQLSVKDTLLIFSGERQNDMVEFDTRGNAYTLVDARVSNKTRSFLLFSNDRMKSWQVLPISNGGHLRIESDILHNSRIKPPVILSKAREGLKLYVPTILESGKLQLGEPITLVNEPKALYHGVMAGAGNACVTSNGKTFVIYMVNEEREGRKGAPHYIVSYDHKTGHVSKPLFLEESGHRIDGHNSPVIAIDSDGYLHALLGTHWHSMVYLKSKMPNDISSWEKPQYVAGNGDNSWSRNGITYPGFVIDKENTIHLVVRGRTTHYVDSDPAHPSDENNWGPFLNYGLVYIRKKENGEWEKRKDLVIPKHMDYSNWYHKISIDKTGNVFLSYLYYAHNLNEAEKEEYKNKWPEECIGREPENKVVSAHDPVMVHTFNGGDSWHITQTKNFK